MAARKRKAVITEEEVTTVTRRQIALTEETQTHPWPVIERAAGWEPGHGLLSGAELRAQRGEQLQHCVRFLLIRSFGTGDGDAETVRCAAHILRAGPSASPLEKLHGRSA